MILRTEHYADDLEVDIDEIMGGDFNVDLEDGSPNLVSAVWWP